MFLLKDNKFDNSLARLMKKKREKNANKIRKGGYITTKFTEVKRIMRILQTTLSTSWKST